MKCALCPFPLGSKQDRLRFGNGYGHTICVIDAELARLIEKKRKEANEARPVHGH